MASSTTPRTKWFSHMADAHSSKAKARSIKAEDAPIYMIVGMVVVVVAFAVHSGKQQLRYMPGVQVTKKNRGLMPEVADPDNVVQGAEKFIRKSFFRKVAHIQDSDHGSSVPDHIRGDIFANVTKSETLKSVGVEPSNH
ncbi:hypothetical protein Sjap_000789 [Stephania japonica]|uniref:Transmembrane protein n=1 Tax=Stephania japonica TaxID=461633 RepID=A0AAP0PSW0_9MAGN